MIDIKTPEELAAMREGGQKLGRIRERLMGMVRPGVLLTDIEAEAQRGIKEAGGVPSFATVEDYKWATCLCVNEQVVHGIPTPYAIKAGDVVTVDVGMIYKGFHTDTADTRVAGMATDPNITRFLDVGKTTLSEAIAVVKPGNHIGHISQAIERGITGAGYSIVKSLTGHGVGRTLHEDPQIPGFVRGAIEKTPLITVGMTIAVEVIYAMGKGSIVYSNDDGWTLETEDRSLTAVFEHTLAVTPQGVEILTAA